MGLSPVRMIFLPICLSVFDGFEFLADLCLDLVCQLGIVLEQLLDGVTALGGKAPIEGDIAIRNGKIAAIGKDLGTNADTVIDAMGLVKRIILTRPAVEAGERLGFLPGDLKDKLDPYLQPLYDALGDMIPSKRLQSFMEEGIIQIAPLAYMRGRTLDRAFVILDEAQNTSLGQLKMFLTRMGSDAKFIVTGDPTQIDLPNKADSGLMRGVELVRDIKGISIVEFGKEDIVRHPLVTKIVDAFERT